MRFLFAAHLQTRSRSVQHCVFDMLTSAWSPPQDHLNHAAEVLAGHPKMRAKFYTEFGPQTLSDGLVDRFVRSYILEILRGCSVSDPYEKQERLERLRGSYKFGELIGFEHIGSKGGPSQATFRYTVRGEREGAEGKWIAFHFSHDDDSFALIGFGIGE